MKQTLHKLSNFVIVGKIIYFIMTKKRDQSQVKEERSGLPPVDEVGTTTDRKVCWIVFKRPKVLALPLLKRVAISLNV